MKKKKNEKVVTVDGITFTIINKVPEWSNDPFFERKAEKSRKTLERVGFPKLPPPRKK